MEGLVIFLIGFVAGCLAGWAGTTLLGRWRVVKQYLDDGSPVG